MDPEAVARHQTIEWLNRCPYSPGSTCNHAFTMPCIQACPATMTWRGLFCQNRSVLPHPCCCSVVTRLEIQADGFEVSHLTCLGPLLSDCRCPDVLFFTSVITRVLCVDCSAQAYVHHDALALALQLSFLHLLLIHVVAELVVDAGVESKALDSLYLDI